MKYVGIPSLYQPTCNAVVYSLPGYVPTPAAFPKIQLQGPGLGTLKTALKGTLCTRSRGQSLSLCSQTKNSESSQQGCGTVDAWAEVSVLVRRF